MPTSQYLVLETYPRATIHTTEEPS